MGKSQRVRLADVRDVSRLLGECHELGDDAVVWQTHFSAGLAKLVGADVVMVGEVNGCLRGPLTMPGGTAWGFENGFDVAGYRILGEWLAKDPRQSRLYTKLRGRLRAATRPSVTVPRQELFAEQEWRRSPDYQLVLRTMGADAVVHSHCPIDETRDAFSGVVCCRAAGRRTFNQREVALIHLINEEVARLVGGALARWCEPQASQLPPREREALRCLLEGSTDRQIADRLHLSPHTVNQYTKEIFRHFGVHSRTALLARWVRRGWGNEADWNIADSVPQMATPA